MLVLSATLSMDMAGLPVQSMRPAIPNIFILPTISLFFAELPSNFCFNPIPTSYCKRRPIPFRLKPPTNPGHTYCGQSSQDHPPPLRISKSTKSAHFIQSKADIPHPSLAQPQRDSNKE